MSNLIANLNANLIAARRAAEADANWLRKVYVKVMVYVKVI
jgi:hypothetical protein